MHAPKQFAIGFAIVLIAAFFTPRNHLRSWRDRTADTVGDYIEDWVRGYTLPIVIIGLWFMAPSSQTVRSSLVPGSHFSMLPRAARSTPPEIEILVAQCRPHEF